MKRRDALKTICTSGCAITMLPSVFTNDLIKFDLGLDEGRTNHIIEKLRDEPPALAEIKTERGGPRLFVNGKETYPIFAWSWKLLKYTPHFKKSGINIIYPILQISDAWLGQDKYDWHKFDQFFAQLLDLNPDAFFLSRILLYAPDWWKDEHPQELITTTLPFDPKLNMSTPELLIGEGGQRWWRDFPKCASFASEVWKRDTTKMLENFLAYYENSPLRSRIIGYHPGLGTTGGEWHYSHSMFLPDFSEPMKKKLGYIPEKDARLNTSFGLFRDPAKEKSVIKFYEDFHNLNADTILHFTRVIKETTNRRVLCGVFYNYLLENVWIQEGGHLAPEKILNSEDIDFIASPYTYQQSNKPGSKKGETDVYDHVGNWLGRGRGAAGDGGYRILIDSIKKHGKLPCVEMDPATFVDKGRDMNYAGSGSETLKGSIRLLKRDLGQMFATGSGGWLCDIGAVKGEGWYAPDPIVREIKKLVDLGDRRKDLHLDSVSQIAALYDAKNFFVTKHWMAEEQYEKGGRFLDFFNYWFCDSQARAIHRIGAPVDFLYRFDLKPEDTNRYKLFLMVNLFYLTNDEVVRLKSFFKNSNATVVWYYAPGFVSPKKLDLNQMENLSGFKFKILSEPAPLIIQTEINDKFGTIDLKFGTNTPRYPRSSVINEDIKPLGFWEDNGEVAFAMRKFDGWTSIYVGTAPVPVEILRWLVKISGGNLWSTKSDIVRAIEGAAMIVATETGKRVLNLPKPMKDVEGGISAKKHELGMEFGEVRIFI